MRQRRSRRSAVTPAEFHVLRALWELGAGTVAAIHAARCRTHRVSYNTVLTQVRHLHSKGYLQREAVGRAHVYRPRLTREAALHRVVQQFIEDFFDGGVDELGSFLQGMESSHRGPAPAG